MNLVCCSMCLSKDGLEIEVKSHSEHGNRFPEQVNVKKTCVHSLKMTIFRLRKHRKQSYYSGKQKDFQKRAKRKISFDTETPTFVRVAQSVAFQCDFWFELFAAQIAEVTSLSVVPVHVGRQVAPTAAGVVAQIAGIWPQTCTQKHKSMSGLDNCTACQVFFFFFLFFILCHQKSKSLVKISNVLRACQRSAQERHD